MDKEGNNIEDKESDPLDAVPVPSENISTLIHFFGGRSCISEQNVRQSEREKLELRKGDPLTFTFENYPMNSNPRGSMLLINNYLFKKNYPKRDGWQADEKNLCNVFKQIGFKIESHENLSKLKMKTKIKEFAKKRMHMCIICILSHGDEDHIMAADDYRVKREEIIAMVNSENLRGKPKFFVFQSCRGNQFDLGVEHLENYKDSEDEHSQDGPNRVPTFEDMVILLSSVPGYSSFRDPKTGSWLIEEMCKVFCKYAVNTELVDMLNIVAINLRRKESSLKQTIEISLRHFTKKLYFNPLFLNIKGIEFKLLQKEEASERFNLTYPTSPTTIGPIQYTLPTTNFSKQYRMNHKRRGKAFIFNQQCFDDRLNFQERTGTQKDCQHLAECLEQLGFNPNIFTDEKSKFIRDTLHKAEKEDHSDADCIFVAVLTHGNDGKLNLYAKDKPYSSDILWKSFTSDKCPSLAGKPKIVLIQACRGRTKDLGTNVYTFVQTDSLNELRFKIPTHSDFLIANSTLPGFVSSRNIIEGTCFIQTFVEILSKEANQTDLLTIFTRVLQKVALDFEIGAERFKQMPCLTSTLTRDILFDQEGTDIQAERNDK